MNFENNYEVGIIGIGSFVPDNILTNDDMAKIVDTSDEWITTRTGIKERRKASEYQTTSDLALEASKKAIEDSNLNIEDIDLIIVATMSPDFPTPATACVLQKKLGCKNIPAFDISAACSGFIYGLSIAKGMVKSGTYNNVLLVGAETMSKIVDWEDRSTCVLFGDGAGAVVLSKVSKETGIIDIELGSEGGGVENLYIPSGGSKKSIDKEVLNNRDNYLKMNGGEVFKFAVRKIDEVSRSIIYKNDITEKNIDYFVPHQANIRIIDSAMKKLKLQKEKVITNIEKYGNMSAASIIVAIDESVKMGKVKKGDLLLAVGFGGGLTWGAALIKWSKS